jgi:hypothetical protein
MTRTTILAALALSLGVICIPGLARADALRPAAERRPTRRSTSRMITGMVLTGHALALFIPGVVFTGVGLSKKGKGTSTDQDDADIETGFGLMLIVLGSLPLAAVGIPLWVSGASPAGPTAARLPAWAQAIPTVTGGPRSVGLRWSF